MDEPVHRPPRQKINKETQALNYTLYQIDLVGIYRTFHQKKKKKISKKQNTLSSSVYRRFSRIDNI